MSSQDPTSRAADLTEQILAEISALHQDWEVVARLARELSELADGMVARRTEG